MITARVYCEISGNKTQRNQELAREKTLDDAVYSLRHKDENLCYCQPKVEPQSKPTSCYHKAKGIYKEKQR